LALAKDDQINKRRSQWPFIVTWLSVRTEAFIPAGQPILSGAKKQHNRGTGARYTRTHRPVKLVYIESQPDRSTAMRRERVLKALKHQQKKALIIRNGTPNHIHPQEGSE
jgi:hypothetical protein